MVYLIKLVVVYRLIVQLFGHRSQRNLKGHSSSCDARVRLIFLPLVDDVIDGRQGKEQHHIPEMDMDAMTINDS